MAEPKLLQIEDRVLFDVMSPVRGESGLRCGIVTGIELRDGVTCYVVRGDEGREIPERFAGVVWLDKIIGYACGSLAWDLKKKENQMEGTGERGENGKES